MVKFNNMVSSLALSLLSLSEVSAAINPVFKRYDNSSSSATSCSTYTSTSVVSVYGPSYTGAVSNAYSEPAIDGSWTDDGPVWNLYIPQSLYNYSSIDLVVESYSGITVDASAFTLYTGDIDNFINPGAIYTTSSNGLEFDGRTQDPLLKIVFAPTYDSSKKVFSVDFSLNLDIIGSIISLKKREIESFELSETIDVSSSSSSAASSGTVSTTATSSSVATTATDAAVSGAVSTSTKFNPTVITITSCSNNACSETTASVIPSVVVTVVNETVVSYTTYCPISKDVPTAKTVSLVTTTVTVDNVETVYTTFCPVSGSTAAETTKTGTTAAAETTKTGTTAAAETTKTGTAAAAAAATTTKTGSTAEGTTTVAVEVTSTSTVASTAATSGVSVYQGAANAVKASNYLAGGITAAIFGFVMML